MCHHVATIMQRQDEQPNTYQSKAAVASIVSVAIMDATMHTSGCESHRLMCVAMVIGLVGRCTHAHRSALRHAPRAGLVEQSEMCRNIIALNIASTQQPVCT